MPAVSGLNLSSSGSLIAATLNLKLVESLLAAIRTADQYGARIGNVGEACGPCCDRFCHEPVWREPCYLPRRVIHPTPRYLPRPVIHPQPRIGPDEPVPPPAPKACVPHITAGPQPPWKTLPWQEPAPSPDVIKVFVQQPDTVTKGTLIDLFL